MLPAGFILKGDVTIISLYKLVARNTRITNTSGKNHCNAVAILLHLNGSRVILLLSYFYHNRKGGFPVKKLYDELEMEVIRFNAEDVIVTSGEEEECEAVEMVKAGVDEDLQQR